jgi:hypothetical protein
VCTIPWASITNATIDRSFEFTSSDPGGEQFNAPMSLPFPV